MISLTSGKRIAIIDQNKRDCIYISEDDENGPHVDTTPEHKFEMFKKFLMLDRKLSSANIRDLEAAYKSGKKEFEGKLNRKYIDGIDYVNESLKRHLDYGTDTNISPIVDEPSYRIFVSGLSGSGKSTVIAEFLKNNPVRKGSGIFLFSPVQKDEAMDKIKNLIRINLDEVEKELKKEFTIDDIPEGSVVIFDDVESFEKKVAKQYLELRDIFLERGRHRDISTITVSHNACAGNLTKVSIRESQYWILFPKHNSRDTRNILKTYGGLDKSQIDEICDMKTRWCFYKKSIPRYAIGQHSVITYG